MPSFSKLPLLLALLALPSCRPAAQKESTSPPDSPDGNLLAATHCTRCHLQPTPQDLPKEQWQHVLGWMAHYVGMAQSSEDPSKLPHLLPDLVVTTPLMSPGQWQTLREHFLSNSQPEPTPSEVYRSFATPSPLFQPGEKFSSVESNQIITAIGTLAGPSDTIIAANATSKEIILLNHEGSYQGRRGPFATETVDFFELDGRTGLVQIGHLFGPGNEGHLQMMGDTNRDKPIIASGFPRTARARLLAPCGDQPARFILSCFGDGGPGDLRLIDTSGQNPKTLLPLRGCVDAHPVDLDHDGDEDILALFSQGTQQMWSFLNDGSGNYPEQKLLWQKNPSQGYTGFQIADFDNDGNIDIATFSGNNLEIPDPPIRRYHGIHLYQGKGNGTFEPKSFIPLPGATALEIADFNLDGKPDLAAVANFVDWRIDHPAGAIIALQADPFVFNLERLPVASQAPYLSLKSLDIDADGDPDLLLGGFPMLPQEMPFDEERRARTAINKQWSLTLLRNDTN
ncbi:MAG: FG-GAP repeat domain-containing protein [Verrucomicrobiaceae bacterium]